MKCYLRLGDRCAELFRLHRTIETRTQKQSHSNTETYTDPLIHDWQADNNSSARVHSLVVTAVSNVFVAVWDHRPSDLLATL